VGNAEATPRSGNICVARG